MHGSVLKPRSGVIFAESAVIKEPEGCIASLRRSGGGYCVNVSGGIYAIYFRLFILLWAQRRERRVPRVERRVEVPPYLTATPGRKANLTASKDVRTPTMRTKPWEERRERGQRAAGRAGAAGTRVGVTQRNSLWRTTRGIFPVRTGLSGGALARLRQCIQTAAAKPASPLPAAGSASKAQSRYMWFLAYWCQPMCVQDCVTKCVCSVGRLTARFCEWSKLN